MPKYFKILISPMYNWLFITHYIIDYLLSRTFTKVEYHGHPKLNLIIGPNGSGKSSIVTAFILGFGGSPKDINRGDKVIIIFMLTNRPFI